MNTNRLVEIPNTDWQKLAELYSDKKTLASGWNCLTNYINWLGTGQELDFIKIYSLNGDWSDGTFIIQDANSIMFNTLDSNHDRLRVALDCIESLEELSRFTYICICDFSHRYVQLINNYMEPTGVKIDVAAAWLHLETDKALNFQLDFPEKTSLQSLNRTHVEIVNSFWAYQYPGSEEFIGRLIHFNLPRGSLGLLQVREEHKRKGFGSLLVRAISKRLAEKGTQITTAVVDSNLASKRLFEKLGFKEVDTIHWVCRPLKGN